MVTKIIAEDFEQNSLTAIINNEKFSGITAACRLWPQVQAAIAAGETVEDYEPSAAEMILPMPT